MRFCKCVCETMPLRPHMGWCVSNTRVSEWARHSLERVFDTDLRGSAEGVHFLHWQRNASAHCAKLRLTSYQRRKHMQALRPTTVAGLLALLFFATTSARA